MRFEDFKQRFYKEIAEIFKNLDRPYSLSEDEFAQALHRSAQKYLFSSSASDIESVKEFLLQLNLQDLCFSQACAKGDEQAWEEFMQLHKGYLQAVARQMVGNETAAEELFDIVLTQLYGLKTEDEVRVSKFSAYSGRGSLKGWLRAVLFQVSVDQHRSQKKFVQPEDGFEKLLPPVKPSASSSSKSTHYREVTQKAVSTAISQLEPKMKLMLSYYYYDNLTLKQIGQLFDIHEATASRWLQKAQQTVKENVAKILKHEHKFSQAEIEECFSYAAESEDLDLKSLLAEAESERGP